MNKLFIFIKAALTTVSVLTFCLLIGCAQSSEIKIIAANQSIADDKKPTITPAINGNVKDESPPLDSAKIPTVTYCDLIKNSADYDKKIVRVRAIYFNGFEQIYLYDDKCELNQPPAAPEKVPAETWAQWDKSFVSKGDSDEAKLNRRLNGFGRKDVTVTGRFQSTNEQGDSNAPNLFGHMNCCRFQFSIMRVEKSVELGDKAVKTQID